MEKLKGLQKPSEFLDGYNSLQRILALSAITTGMLFCHALMELVLALQNNSTQKLDTHPLLMLFGLTTYIELIHLHFKNRKHEVKSLKNSLFDKYLDSQIALGLDKKGISALRKVLEFMDDNYLVSSSGQILDKAEVYQESDL